MTGHGYGHVSRRFYVVIVTVFFFIATGCTPSALRKARSEFYGGSPDRASEILLEADNISGRDKLLFLMEKGLILHHQGLYEESMSVLLEASELIEQQEVISVGRQTGSLVTTEWLTEYKGEYSERLWVHTYLMMNFLLLNDYEGALVEAKQALEVFGKYPDSLSGDYITRGLIAHCYENLGLDNDAYIEYRKLSELMDNPGPAAFKLYQLGTRLGFHDEVEQYREYIPETEQDWLQQDPFGELVLFISQGRVPVKVPGNIVIPPSIRFSFPRYKESSDVPLNISVTASTGKAPLYSVSTDMGKVAREAFEERAAMIIAKETARAAAKEAISRQAGNEYDDLVETVIRALFFILEEPDTRSWHTLPAGLAMTVIPLEKSTQDVTVSIGGYKKTISLTEEEINSRRRFYRSIRVYN